MSNILLIESDKLLAANIGSYLKRKGHSVDWQVNPQEALARADSKKPDLVILDLFLAQNSGVEFLYEFRSYPDWFDTPVIILSSLAAEDIKTSVPSLEHLNVAAFHYKPVTSLDALTYAVEQALQTVEV